jgi:DNA polymerase-3 subunit alpha
MAETIIQERKNGPYKDIFDFVTRLYQNKISETQVLKLINAGAFDKLHNSRASLRNTIKAALQYAQLISDDNGQLNLGIAAIAPPGIMMEQDDPLENLDLEYDAIGVMLSSNVLDYKKDLLKAKNVVPINELVEHNEVNIAGIVKVKKVIKTKKGSSMAFVKIFDQTGDIEMTVFPNLFAEVASLLEKNNIILVKGRYEVKNDESNFIAETIENLEN